MTLDEGAALARQCKAGIMSKTPIKHETDGEWEWFSRQEELPYEITGKYLFFSSDRDLLVQIATDELATGSFHEAKIPMVGHNVSSEYVLCLYCSDDSRKHELAAKYRGVENVKYRYWKSDEATLDGRYSDAFLRSLPRALRSSFRSHKQ